MARRPHGNGDERGTAHLVTTAFVVAGLVLGALICLALLSWLGRMS